MDRPTLVVGVGVTGAAVASALVRRRQPVVLVDDRPTDRARQLASQLGVELRAAPDAGELAALVGAAGAVVPAPGLPATHPVFAAARRLEVPIRSEFDLAARWDHRPVLAITGTDGKTTVTTLAAEMLRASGVAAAAVGNTEVPLVAAIDDPSLEVFVVEASSFRLDHSEHFAPQVGTWLNFAPDHLDNHPSLAAYEAAKARIWRDQKPDQVAVGNVDDPVVARHLAEAPARRVGFGLTPAAEGGFRIVEDRLVTADDQVICPVSELAREFPHDRLNALAAAATALPGGATLDGVAQVLRSFRGLPHRIALVGEAGGVRYFDDSKATTPHAAAAAVGSFDSVVWICGGRNKGLDLGVMAQAAGPVRAAVAIGESAGELVAAFGPTGRPVHPAGSMDEAVALAADLAQPGDTVLLSPGCASFDWYGGYAERGDDFARAVRARLGSER